MRGEIERMAKRSFHERHGIVRSAIREDLFRFFIPWIIVMAAGTGVSAWDLVGQQEDLDVQSAPILAGLALIVIGFAYLLVAHITLWRSYSSFLVIRKDHQLITHGPYRFTRHPIYLGNITVFIGIAVFASSLPGFLIMLGLIPVFLSRIRIEEKLLTEEFGDVYRTYKAATKKLVPFIY